MTDDLSKINYPKLALPIGRIRLPKFLYIILFVLGILVLIVSGLNFYLKNLKEISTNKTSKISDDTIDSSFLKASETTLKLINKQKNDNGIYNTGVMCSADFTECKDLGESHYSGIPVIWGRFNFYLKNKDQEDLDLVKNDIDNYFEMVKTKTIGANNDGCILLYDLWKDESFDKGYKEKISTICSSFQYPGSLNYEEIKKTDGELLISIDKKIDKILKWQPGESVDASGEYDSIIQELGFDIDFLPSLMSNHLSESKILNNDYSKTQANKIFDVLLDILFAKLNTQTNNNEYFCRTGKSVLDFGLINNHSKSLELAKKIAPIGFKDKNNIDCALLSSQLENLDPTNIIYSNYKNDFLKTNVVNNFSDLGFWKKTGEDFYIDVGFNGLMFGLLSQ